MNKSRRRLLNQLLTFFGLSYIVNRANALEALDLKEKNFSETLPTDEILQKLKEMQTEGELYAIKDKWP